MRKFTLLFIMALVSTVVFGQSMLEKRNISIPVKDGDSRNTTKAAIIWENDFSNAAEWTMEYDAGNPNDGPWVIGTTAPAGYYSEGMGPIASTTAANGFAMYDSDAIGTSESGTQDSKMTYTGTIDCSAYTKVAISFESYYRKYHGIPYVEVSVNGTDWTQYAVHTDIEGNGSSANPQLVMVNITAVAASQATVYLRFRYIGEWDYAWMVDDITIFEAPDYDVELNQARVNFWPQYIDYGYSGFYGSVPQEQIDGVGAPVFFSGIIKNYGSQSVTPTLNVSVKDPSNTEIFTDAVTFEAAIAAEEFDTVATGSDDNYFFFDPATIGQYTFDMNASIEGQVDENPVNNDLQYQMNIVNNVYAHDQGNVTGSWSTCNYTTGCVDGDIIGVVYQYFVTTTVNSIDFYVSDMTEVGTGYVAKIMTWDEGTSAWVEAGASTYVTIDDVSQVGVMHSVAMADDYIIEVPEGEFVEVLAAVEIYTGGTLEWRFGIDGSVPTSGFETWMYFSSETTWYYYGGTHVPIIRMNVGTPSSVNEETASNISIYPNPSTGIVNITNVEGASIEVLNIMGQVVASVESSSEINNIDLSNNANGTYFVRVVKGNEVSTTKINLVK